MEEKIFAFWLCNLPGIGQRKIEQLLAYFGSAREVFLGTEKQYEQAGKLNRRDIEMLLSVRSPEIVQRQYENARKLGICFVYREEEAYPRRLRQVENMPYGLFYRGSLPREDVSGIAVVGAREASGEGRQIAAKFGYELAENGIQVISGMARGIDIAAQRGAMRAARGRTYGVMGTGVDICYPRQHIEDYMRIQQRGGVISELPLKAPAMPYHFPMRNRIISALSDGILVIEAGKDSGSLITAEIGLEQGREIFVVPGNIVNLRYEGSNELLKSGAIPVTQIRDILDGLGLFFDCDVMERKKKSQEMLETAEKMVYASLSLEPVHISEIMEKTGMELSSVMEVIFSLQMKQLVRADGNQFFTIKL